jgi:hypothetical protein
MDFFPFRRRGKTRFLIGLSQGILCNPGKVKQMTCSLREMSIGWAGSARG